MAVVREPPAELTDAQVLFAVRAGWNSAIERVEHFAVGFGAHHWRAYVGGVPRLFVTYDRVGREHTLGSLERAYEGAIKLAESGLEFVVASVRTRQGAVLMPLIAGVLSCTPWLDGDVVGESGHRYDSTTAAANLADLNRLHRAQPPPGLGRWVPLIGADFAERLSALLAHRWDTGPYGEPARRAVARCLATIDQWTRGYVARAGQAPTRPWVATHGETHTGNQIRTVSGIRFVDWESLLLAPRERDLSCLVQAGYGLQAGADPVMVDLFDLEWRLSEIDQYTRWFSAAHSGTTDDAIAFDGLLEELQRPPWWPTPGIPADREAVVAAAEAAASNDRK